MKRAVTRLARYFPLPDVAALTCALYVLAVGMLVLCTAAFAQAGDTGGRTQVPRVTGYTLAQAEEVLRRQHLEPQLADPGAAANADSRVVMQDPAANIVVPWGRAVVLTLRTRGSSGAGSVASSAAGDGVQQGSTSDTQSGRTSGGSAQNGADCTSPSCRPPRPPPPVGPPVHPPPIPWRSYLLVAIVVAGVWLWRRRSRPPRAAGRISVHFMTERPPVGRVVRTANQPPLK